MKRILKTKDINFIQTLIENKPDKIAEIKIKDKLADKRVANIAALAKKNGIGIISNKIERFEASFYPREMENIKFLENKILKKEKP
jgi:hypothetical protein